MSSKHTSVLKSKALLMASTAALSLVASLMLPTNLAYADGTYSNGGLAPVAFPGNLDPFVISILSPIPSSLDLTAAQNTTLTFNTLNILTAGADNVINLNGNDVNSAAFHGLWLWSTVSDVVVNANADITSFTDSIHMIDTTTGGLLANGGGVGTLTSTAGDGVNARTGLVAPAA